MNVDASDFKRRYAELSDEGLLSIVREDLIGIACECYDEELARRELQYDRTVERRPAKKYFPSPQQSKQAVRAFWHRIPRPVRVVGAFVGNWLAAVAGTAMTEDEFKPFYHPATFGGLYMREILLSTVVASLLGCFVYYKWKSATAKWIWIYGACYLAWQAGARLAPTYIPDWDLGDLVNSDAVRMVWVAAAFRAIAYSGGAWRCGPVLVSAERSLSPETPGMAAAEVQQSGDDGACDG